MFEVGGNNEKIAWEDIHIGGKDINLGWPFCEGYCNQSAPNPDFPQCDCTKYDSPVYSYPHAGGDACVIGGVLYRGEMFPEEYQDKLFITDYVQRWIKYLEFDSSGRRVIKETTFERKGDLAILALKQGPDVSVLSYHDLITYRRDRT